MSRLFDSHAHYDDERFADDRDELLNRLFERELDYIVNVGSSLESSKTSLALAESYKNMYCAVGIHPGACVQTLEYGLERAIGELEDMLGHDKARAIGEIGLDFHYEPELRAEQERVFRAQMELASRTGYRVIIHDREAHGACMGVIRDYPDVTGVFHSFSGSAELAAELVKAGWYISFSGVITFNNATRVAEVVKSIPDDRLLIETDCPYLAPVPYRGKRNNSAFMAQTAAKAAELRSMSAEELVELTCRNAMRFFGIE